MVLVIAEIGVNWDGDFLLLEKMVKKSKESGFDAIKLQSFNEDMIKNNPIKEKSNWSFWLYALVIPGGIIGIILLLGNISS